MYTVSIDKITKALERTWTGFEEPALHLLRGFEDIHKTPVRVVGLRTEI
jgi:hypothetical protein